MGEKVSSKRRRIILSFLAIAVSSTILYISSSNPFLSLSIQGLPTCVQTNKDALSLDAILARAAMKDKTVILTTLNDAWAKPGSVFDLFLESFRIGNQTQSLLNHLVVIALDHKAYDRCVQLHPHCFAADPRGINYTGEAYFMAPDYLEMMWTRIDLLTSVLRLGYNFAFTDADIMWLRDPFPRFLPDADFQISCDRFFGNSSNLHNHPNGGFNYVKSNNKTIQFYEYWYKARNYFPKLHDQDVLNKIKFNPLITKNIGMQIRFLETAYFGAFCQPSKDFSLVCTMHANCCIGLDSKVSDLKLVLQDWRKFMDHSSDRQSSWSVPNKCSIGSFHPRNQPKNVKA